MGAQKHFRFKEFCRQAMCERGFTHIKGSDGKLIALADLAAGRIKPPRAPRGCFWAGNGASLVPNITLYNRWGENCGYYKLVRA